jgi:hypothetical protein
MQHGLRWLAVGTLGVLGLVFLAFTLFTAGFSLIVAVPFLLLAAWLARYDFADAEQVSTGGILALVLGGAFIAWVVVILVAQP